jgi:microcystin-dependent protein
VPNGATVWVYCDGTNFNAIGTESVGNFEVNGNLTVTGNTNAAAATFTGNVSTANLTATNFIGAGATITSINASNITSGTISNARTTASSSNGASTIVTRDASGNFAANAITATTQPVTTNDTTLATTAFVRSIIPAGVILMWSGSVASIPSGWLLCNGSSGTPDLRDRFIVGAGSSYAVGATGGSATNTLTTSELPSHTHSLSASGTTSSTNIDHTHSGTTGGMNSNASHTHSITDPGHQHIQGPFNARPTTGASAIFGTNDPTPDAGDQQTVSAVTGITVNSTNIDHTHSITTGSMNSNTTHTHTVTVTGTSGATGSGAAFTNLPPYYALAYIMKS